MSCSTGTYDCHWQPSPFYVMKFINRTDEERNLVILCQSPPANYVRWIQLEWCPRCRLVRIPNEVPA